MLSSKVLNYVLCLNFDNCCFQLRTQRFEVVCKLNLCTLCTCSGLYAGKLFLKQFLENNLVDPIFLLLVFIVCVCVCIGMVFAILENIGKETESTFLGIPNPSPIYVF